MKVLSKLRATLFNLFQKVKVEKSILWLPDSAKEALCVDNSEVESIDTMVFVNQSITNWLNSELDTGTLTDILMQYDVSPERIDDLESLLEFLI